MLIKSEPQWSGHTFHLDMPNAEASAYRKRCTPVSRVPNIPEVLPIHETSTGPAGSVSEQSSTMDLRRNALPSYTTPQSPPQGRPPDSESNEAGGVLPVERQLKIYWCVDKVWTEPSQTRLCTLSGISNDRQLCKELLDELKNVQGLPGQVFSWKTCTRVDFISVRATFTLASPQRFSNKRVLEDFF